MKRKLKSLLAVGIALSSLLFGTTAKAAIFPNPAEAVTLGNAINNNTQALRYLPGNSATIATYLPRMADCTAVYTIAKNNMDALIAYVAAGNPQTAIINAYIGQVNSALTGGQTCAQPSLRTPPESFNSNGVKYTNIGWPSSSFVSAVVLTTNNMPSHLRVNLVNAFNAGWKFYIFRTPDDFKNSTLYTTLGITPAQFLQYRSHSAATIAGTNPTQIFFENYYPTPTSNALTTFIGTTNASSNVAHENEHIKDIRLGLVSQNDAGFISAYNAGVAAYNAATGHDPDIGANFVANATTGKSELFAELGAYWDTSHWPLSGVNPNMASKTYTSAEVLNYFSAAWTYFQAKRAAGTW